MMPEDPRDNPYQNNGAGMMATMYTSTFGNGNFMIQPPSPQDPSKAFPVLPYFSIEAIFYEQQSSNPVISPNNMMGGSHIGQQVISGQYTMQDSNRTDRYQMGYQSAQ